MTRRGSVALLLSAALLAACSSSSTGSITTAHETTAAPASTAPSSSTSGSTSGSTTSAPGTTAASTSTPTGSTLPALARFTVQPGTEQIAVLGATPGEALHAIAPDGTDAGTIAVDAQGSALWRNLTPGNGWHISAHDGTSVAVTVASRNDVPPASLYTNQPLLPAGGFGYITTRDGTTLSANVILPGPAAKGPYPTVVEYSGYQPSDPASAQLAAIYTAQGFAYVGVNMRGTGCSGGSYRFFELMQSLDGYDVIEAVAAQSWVKFHTVGMVGISYPGISQLFVAATQPPHLNSITPLSVLDDSWRSTLYPGGILNTGFAVDWTKARVEQARPYGQAWTKQRADKGDTRCAANQKLRLQNPDLLKEIENNPYYSNPLGDSIAPYTFVQRIKVPVFIAGAWQDEQTGGHFAEMLSNFTGSPHVYVTLMNGLHTESLSPPVARRYMEFLQLYVGKKVPDLGVGPVIASTLGSIIWGVSAFGPFPSRFHGMTYTAALHAFESEPSVRILFEQGGNPAYVAGTPEPYFTAQFDRWPLHTSVATSTWLLGAGTMTPSTDTVPTAGSESFVADPSKLPATFYSGDGNGVWRANARYDWRPMPNGYGLGYVTAPLTTDTVVAGTASADLWVKASTPDVDLQVTISEVRPDGKEIYVQSGWLRASQRALNTSASTPIRPVHTNSKADSAMLPASQWTPVRIEVFPFAHPFRAGSRIRLTVNAPGNARAIWQFRTIDKGATVQIAHDPSHPSALVLQTVAGITVPQPAPPACGWLRGQPCRTYTAASNGG